MGILCKWTKIKIEGNYLLFFSSRSEKNNCMRILCKKTQIKFRRNSHLFCKGGQKRKIMWILFRINPDKIWGKFPCIFFSRILYKIYDGFVFISVKPTPMLVNIPVFVIILSAFKLTFRSTHSSLNLTTTPHYVLVNEWWWSQKGSLNFLKLGTLKIHDI